MMDIYTTVYLVIVINCFIDCEVMCVLCVYNNLLLIIKYIKFKQPVHVIRTLQRYLNQSAYSSIYRGHSTCITS